MLYSANVQKQNSSLKTEYEVNEKNNYCSKEICKEDNSMAKEVKADTAAKEDNKKKVVITFSSTDEMQFEECLRNIIKSHNT